MDKKTVLAIVLSMAVLFAYQFYLAPAPRAPRPQAPPRADSAAPPPREAPPAAVSPAAPPAGAPASLDAEAARLLSLQEGAQERKLQVSGGLYDLTISSRGGTIESWRLRGYRGADGLPLEMVPAAAPQFLEPLAVKFRDEGLSRAFAEGLWVAQPSGLQLGPSNREGSLTLSRLDPSGLLVEKRLTFRADSHLVGLSVRVRNVGAATLDVPWWINWGPGLGREAPQRGFQTAPMVFNGAKVQTVKLKREGDEAGASPGFRWLGLSDRYFLAAFIPAAADGEGFVRLLGEGVYSLGPGPKGSFLAPGAASDWNGELFVGPKSLDLLRAYGLGLEQALDFGWFGWVGKPMLALLKFFHGFLLNWGLAIILLTLVVKVILFPVTLNMYRSMRRMQELQPQVTALKKRFKDDPQGLNREMMELYRSRKINPMGGCLPMLIQFPVFLALYKVLSIAIELRGARFLHIKDLSVGEPYLSQVLHDLWPGFPAGLIPLKVLVILMGATMLIQQRLTPTMGDPRQAKMMMFFPLVLTAAFWNFSSGLVVYFFFSNVLAIGEQMLIRKLTAPVQAPQTPEERKGKR